MSPQWSQFCSHLARIAAVVLALVVAMLLPYSLEKYDGLAQTLSVSAQLVGIVGLLLVPVGALWLTYELRKQRRLEQQLPHTDRRYLFAVSTLVVGSTGATFIAFAAIIGERLSFGILGLVLWMLLLRRLTPPIRRMRKGRVRTP